MRTLIHKCDLTLVKDNIAYMIVILATHSRLLFGCWTMDLIGELDTESDTAFETKNPNILANPYCKESVGDVLTLDPKILFP